MEKLEGLTFLEPFPHLIINNFYNDEELELIWEELKFYTKPGKFLPAKDYGGIEGYTDAKALCLDNLYVTGDPSYRSISNILTVNRKVFDASVLQSFSEIHDCCGIAPETNFDVTKVRYYHNGDFYDPHTDKSIQFLAFSYFYKEPKRFTGGELIFPKYDYELTCENNSIIMFPGWVEHGVKKVNIEDSNYYEGYGRYAITSFFGCKTTKK